MQRVNSVSVGTAPALKSPPTFAGGLKSRLAGDAAASRDFVASLCGALQARSAIALVVELKLLIGEALTAGAAPWCPSWERKSDRRGFPARAFVLRAYEDAYAVYRACYPSSVRAAFADLFGCDFAEFERSIDFIAAILSLEDCGNG